MSVQGAARLEQLVVPDVGPPEVPIVLSLWLIAEGADVLAGDRVVEIVCGAATVDLEAPVSGKLVKQLADEDAPVTAGMVIAEFASADAG